MSADKLPLVPPLTNTPPAVSGRPARPTNHCNAWFSAYTAPAPSSHEPAYTFDAPTTRSNNTDDSVGAPGTNDKNNGWSTLMHEGASCSVKISSALSAPKPSGVMVWPTSRCNTLKGLGASSGGGSSRMRSTAYLMIASASCWLSWS